MITDDEVRKVYTQMFAAALGSLISREPGSVRAVLNNYQISEDLAFAAEAVATSAVERWAKSLNDGAIQIACEELDRGVNSGGADE